MRLPFCSTLKSGRCGGLAGWQHGPKAEVKQGLVYEEISSCEQRRWYGDAERFGGFAIDGQFKLCRLLDRQLRWFCAFQYLVNIDRRSTV